MIYFAHMERHIYKLVRYAVYTFALVGTAVFGFLHAEQKADHTLSEGPDLMTVIHTANAGTVDDDSGPAPGDSDGDGDDAW